MTVAQLMEELRGLDPLAEVYVPQSDGGEITLAGADQVREFFIDRDDRSIVLPVGSSSELLCQQNQSEYDHVGRPRDVVLLYTAKAWRRGQDVRTLDAQARQASRSLLGARAEEAGAA